MKFTLCYYDIGTFHISFITYLKVTSTITHGIEGNKHNCFKLQLTTIF